MKVKYSSQTNAFGGINFVYNELNQQDLESFFQKNLPSLNSNSKFGWKDIFYSFSSVNYCGGECIEDVKTILSNQFSTNPFFKLCSPDTILRRFKSLATPDSFCRTPRGVVDHHFNINNSLASMNIKLLKEQGIFNSNETILDYDNTIVFNEKADSKMTYKKDYGYQPGVCLVNEDKVLYIENRNGNSDAKSFQLDTLNRMFSLLYDENEVDRINKFRADGASYQYEVIECLLKNVDLFYIGTKDSYVSKYYNRIDNWTATKDKMGMDVLIGYIDYQPFDKRYNKDETPKTFRLLVKKKKRKNGQIDIETQDDYDYHSVITNDFDTPTKEALEFYYHRGAAEKQFDILKNDFGWNNLPFSTLR